MCKAVFGEKERSGKLARCDVIVVGRYNSVRDYTV